MVTIATQTTNLNLVLPEYTDTVDIDVINRNMGIIDTAIGGVDMGTTAATITGAISEHSEDIQDNRDNINKHTLTLNLPISIPESGTTVTYDLVGLTDKYEVVLWNFSDRAENDSPADLVIVTYDGYFSITNNSATVTNTINPVFSIPTSVAATPHNDE